MYFVYLTVGTRGVPGKQTAFNPSQVTDVRENYDGGSMLNVVGHDMSYAVQEPLDLVVRLLNASLHEPVQVLELRD